MVIRIQINMFIHLVLTVLSLSLLVNLSHETTFSRKRFNRLGAPPLLDGTDLPKEEWIQQPVDNFDKSDKRMWSQRYFTNKEYFNRNPDTVFLMIGGEGEITAKWMVAGSWIEYAKEYKALCFQLEHRFYGKSHPTPDMGIKNLRYLTSDQALEDIVNFIKKMNIMYELSPHVKWIVFGGSYPGSLAAWMRLKHPELVHAAISSSGPLLAKADFMEYYSVVVDSLRTSSDECVNEIQSGTQQLSVFLKHMIGQRKIDTKFSLCDPIEKASNLDVASLYETLASNFAGVVQYNKDNRIDGPTKVSNITIDVVCRLMTDESSGNALDRLANVNAMLLEANNETCLDYKYKKMIEELRNVSWSATGAEGGRQWMYQTCNEFGFYQTSGGEPEIFSNLFPLEFFTQQCVDIFGPKFNANHLNDAIDKTNAKYGALGIEASRIVYVHGSIDPWHILGITETTENNSPAIYIKGTAHCANMYPAREDDLPHLKAARVMIAETLGTWLREGK